MNENSSFFSLQNVHCTEIYIGSLSPSRSVAAVLRLNVGVSRPTADTCGKAHTLRVRGAWISSPGTHEISIFTPYSWGREQHCHYLDLGVKWADCSPGGPSHHGAHGRQQNAGWCKKNPAFQNMWNQYLGYTGLQAPDQLIRDHLGHFYACQEPACGQSLT